MNGDMPPPPLSQPAAISAAASASGDSRLAPALLLSAVSLLALGAAWQDRAAREHATRPPPAPSITPSAAAHTALRADALALHQSLSRRADDPSGDAYWTSTLDRLSTRHPGALLRQAQEDIPGSTTNPLPESRLHLTLYLPHELHLLPLLETAGSAAPRPLIRSCRLTRSAPPEGGLLATCTLARPYLPASPAP